MGDNNDTISRYYFESITTKLERTIERQWITILVLIVLLVGTNLAWTYYENQFEDTEVTTVEQQVDTGEGDANVTGIGDINNGTSETEGNEN